MDFLPRTGCRAVSASAFSQARYKVKSDFFRDLNVMVSEFSRNRPLPLWKGYRLYAGDGSTIGLPPSTSVKANFGVESITDQGTERSLARIFMMYSVMDRFVHDAELGPMTNGEKTMLTDSLERMPLEENAVLLLDRGFGQHLCGQGIA